jgi:hypothetical protein
VRHDRPEIYGADDNRDVIEAGSFCRGEDP